MTPVKRLGQHGQDVLHQERRDFSQRELGVELNFAQMF